MNILNYRGKEIKIELNNNEVYFHFLENGVETRIIVDAPSISLMTKQIVLNWLKQKLDNLGNVIASTTSNKRFDDLATWNKWANYDFAGKGMVTNFAPSFNGILAEYFKDENLYCWNPLNNFTFFQPLIFDVATTETTATVTIIDGIGTIEYSKDGLMWQTSNVFEGLETDTEYTIYARTTEDMWESKQKIRTV